MDFDENTCLVCKTEQPAHFGAINRLIEPQNKPRYFKHLLTMGFFGQHSLLSANFIAMKEYVLFRLLF